MDFIQQAQQIIDNNSGYFRGNMKALLAETGDTELIALIPSEKEHHRQFFYAYSENYIFFFEELTVHQDDSYYDLVCIPRHPNTDEKVFCFGGYA